MHERGAHTSRRREGDDLGAPIFASCRDFVGLDNLVLYRLFCGSAAVQEDEWRKRVRYS